MINYREQGRLEFLREALMRLGARVFRKRFGPLPDWARSQIEQADLATLQRWTEMVLDAPSLDALLK